MYTAQAAIEEIDRRPRPHRRRQLRACQSCDRTIPFERLEASEARVCTACPTATNSASGRPARSGLVQIAVGTPAHPPPGVLTAGPPPIRLSPIRDATWRLARYSAMKNDDRRDERLDVKLRRIYDDDDRGDTGYRVLVDRLSPRGVTKAEAALDEWLKDAAPSTELRRWYGHDVTGSTSSPAAIAPSFAVHRPPCFEHLARRPHAKDGCSRDPRCGALRARVLEERTPERHADEPLSVPSPAPRP